MEEIKKIFNALKFGLPIFTVLFVGLIYITGMDERVYRYAMMGFNMDIFHYDRNVIVFDGFVIFLNWLNNLSPFPLLKSFIVISIIYLFGLRLIYWFVVKLARIALWLTRKTPYLRKKSRNPNMRHIIKNAKYRSYKEFVEIYKLNNVIPISMMLLLSFSLPFYILLNTLTYSEQQVDNGFKEMILRADSNANSIPLYSDTDYLFLYLTKKHKIALIPLNEYLLHKNEVEKNLKQYVTTTPSEQFRNLYNSTMAKNKNVETTA
ncbi:MAG: hypothetical protein EP298_02960 [Gammaproteobacteria bacterium]|nr:MAG: hypothetical protein EP298_02960 [Gammaproteobacteria bacterium]UTW43614.1 hypothetical protein KFE69_05855 [bacterium SCSIO 12844]